MNAATQKLRGGFVRFREASLFVGWVEAKARSFAVLPKPIFGKSKVDGFRKKSA